MSSSNTQINFISSTVIKFLKKKFTYDDSFDTVISLLIITCMTNIYGIFSYINEDNIKRLFNDDEFISNLHYFINFILIPCIKLSIFIYILYYIKKNEYHIFIYNYVHNYFYKKNYKPCQKIETHITKNKDTCHDKAKNEIISYDIDISNLPNQINIIYKFMDYHPEFFKRKIGYKLINYINSENESQLYPVFEGKVLFNDPIHNVYGYLNTKYSCSINSKNETLHNYNMSLHINKDENDNKCYIKQLESYTKKQTKYGNLINLFYYKILPKTLITYNYYNEEINKWTEDCKTLRDSYFSVHKEFIFSIMESKADYNLVSSNGWNNLLLYGPPGCHKIDTEIMMYDGTIKLVQNIKENELLMGDDSTPRKVLNLRRGNEMMYKISNVKNESYIVNENHILCLKFSHKKRIRDRIGRSSYQVIWFDNKTITQISKSFLYKNKNKEEVFKEVNIFFNTIKENLIIEIPVINYLDLSKYYKENLKGYKVLIDFPEIKLHLDPYMIGYWLGDGHTNTSAITSQESSVIHYFKNNLEQYKCYLQFQNKLTYRINGFKNNNYFLNTLNDLNLINNKHIPYIYKCNSRENRLKLLAGILDADGSLDKNGVFEFSQSLEHEQIIDDVIYLCRSLGFACYKNKKKTSWTYKGIKNYGEAWRICISGEGIEEIPTLSPRKQANPREQIKDVLVSGIIIEKLENDNYYGFELNNNKRYIMGDFTVTHNTGKSSFINRIGTILKRSILSVDISLYLDKKKDLYSLFHGQEFSLPDSDKKYNINNFIIILEEFDNCIDKLVNLEKIYKFKSDLISSHFEQKQKDILSKMEYVEESESENENSEDKDRGLDIDDIEGNAMNELMNNNLDDECSNIGNLLMENNHKPLNSKEFNGIITQTEMNKERKPNIKKKYKKLDNKNYMKNIKKDVDKNRSFDNNIGVIDRDITNIIKTNNDEMKADTLRLSDLLELFQGPVQIKDRLIIATTNHYDKIKHTLPALFRHGRLTPLKFDYLDWNTLNLLCIYYFDKKMKHHPIDVNISTSQIIELAIKHSLSNNSFIEFENELLIELHKKLI